VINTLIPNNIACVIIHHSSNSPYVHEEEVQEIRNATNSRILEFLSGRNCAHLAIKKLGDKNHQAILRGKNHEPLWPNNIVGSITHCKGYYAAMVSYEKDNTGIGIDAELNTKLPIKIIATTQTKNEIVRNKALLNITGNICINKLIFSAKESVFKFIYPFIKCYINFKDVEIVLDFNAKSFSVLFLTPNLIEKFDTSTFIGRFKYNKKHIVTCIYQRNQILN